MTDGKSVTTMAVSALLGDLATGRTVFCSEADFQHALAWELHRALKPDRLRVEYPLDVAAKQRLDIWLQTNDGPIAIELKYKTKDLVYQAAGAEPEVLQLRNQAAHDLARYDFLKDIWRLERYVDNHPRAVGYAIFLTNDACYWQPPARPDTCDAAFRIHEGRCVEPGQVLAWRSGTSAGTRAGRGNDISLIYAYRFTWQPYATVQGQGYQEFRYLLVSVRNQMRAGARQGDSHADHFDIR